MSEKKKKHKHKKHRSVLPYITTPIIYVLISLIIIVPAGLLAFDFAVSNAQKAFRSFAPSIHEIELNDSAFTPDSAIGGTVSYPSVSAGDKIGELSCQNAGLNTSVYYGHNRISNREGAGLSASSVLPGENGVAEIYGLSSGRFNAIYQIKVGDKLKLDTSWGSYVYSVSEIKTGIEAPEPTMPQCLLLVCANKDNVFSNFNEEKYYVLADCESGPQLEEVQE